MLDKHSNDLATGNTQTFTVYDVLYYMCLPAFFVSLLIKASYGYIRTYMLFTNILFVVV